MRKVGSLPYRLESAIEPTDSDPFWLIDFTKIRYDGGPGKAKQASPVESFDMGGGYGFAEETAVLYDATNGWLVVQYNHHGPRAQAIGDYFSIYDSENLNFYELLLQLNQSAQARLSKKKIFTKLQIHVAPSRLSPAFRKANVSLVSSLESQNKEFGGDFVMVEIGLDRDSNKSLNIKKWLPSFLKMANEEESVSTLRIYGRDDADSTIDPVDLISERLEIVRHSLPLDAGLRYPQKDRFAALKGAYKVWLKDGVIAA